MSLLSQQDHPSEVANQDQETMARPFDKHLSLTGSKPASPASSRRATFPSTTAETVSRTMAAPTTPAKDTSQDGNQPVKPNEKQPTSEPKHKTLSRRATFPSTAKTETPPTTPLPAPIENPSQSDVHSDKKNEPQFKGEPMHAILPKLYLGEYVPPTLCCLNNALTIAPQSKSRREHRRAPRQGYILCPHDQRSSSPGRRARRVSTSAHFASPYR